MGKPNTVANSTVAAAPNPTAIKNAAEPEVAIGTSPLPEKCVTNSHAKKMAQTEPAKVANVAMVIAVR